MTNFYFKYFHRLMLLILIQNSRFLFKYPFVHIDCDLSILSRSFLYFLMLYAYEKNIKMNRCVTVDLCDSSTAITLLLLFQRQPVTVTFLQPCLFYCNCSSTKPPVPFCLLVILTYFKLRYYMVFR